MCVRSVWGLGRQAIALLRRPSLRWTSAVLVGHRIMEMSHISQVDDMLSEGEPEAILVYLYAGGQPCSFAM